MSDYKIDHKNKTITVTLKGTDRIVIPPLDNYKGYRMIIDTSFSEGLMD